MLSDHSTVSVPYVRMLLGGAQAAGLGLAELLAAVGLAPEALADSDGRVPREATFRLWQELAVRTRDDAIGLHVAERLQPGAFAVLDYAARNAPTLGEAFARLARYSRLVHDLAEVRLEVTGRIARLSYDVPKDPRASPRQAAEWAVAIWLVAGRQILEEEWVPTEVWFQHEAPHDTREHRRLFKAPIAFERSTNALLMEAALLERPARRADHQLGAILDRYAQDLLDRLPKVEAFTDRVRRLVAEALRGGDPSVEAVARRLQMSPRTLQRRLKDEGASHQDLVDTMRCELATQYLGERQMAIGEAAFLLGFSEPSAFHRAFKRWTGTTPGEFRRTQ
ncbi:MAG: AraC family transcriptional regulator [Deltaproteobacteria bacterium]|nr:AraC family transcriptional regulator [Deltaproteobacteria bacterium]